ncbi:MAG: hypothetical protein JNK15_15460 [Planctomycetes bacterium]|nr:hypothetical protein [Planctomycetota bacterium]
MVTPTRTNLLLAGLALSVAACGGGSSVSNASPRVSEVPQQSTTGAATFTFDLDDYVSDREGAAMTYAVTSGGGSFAGSVYSNTFDTMGVYTVEFTVTDGTKVTTGSFEVKVTAATFAVVREDQSGLLLLDARTNGIVRVAGSVAVPTFVTGLADGRLVYGKQGAAGDQLWVFDPLTRVTTQLAADAAGDLVYEAKTSTGRILFTEVGTTETTLHLWNPATGLDREIAVGANIDAFVNSADLVFYEVDVAGQADVYAYDIEDDAATAVGSASTAEQVVATLPNGGIVMSRVGGGGETDLFYWKQDVGLVEIGSDQTAIATWNKTWRANGTSSQVVFSAESGAVSEIFAWNPTNGQTTNVSGTVSTGAYDVFAAIGTGNEVVWNRVVSGSEADAYFYDLDAAVGATLRNAADISQVVAVSGDGSTSYAFIRPSGTTSSMLAVSLVGTPATATYAAGGAVSTTVGAVANGDVVAQRTDGTALNVFDVSVGTWGTAITGTGLAFAGDGIDAGDFVYTLTASSQTDLSMWDASGTTSVVVSDTTGNDVFQASTANDRILFTRVVAGNTTADLFTWDGATATRLTQADEANLLHDHTVLGSYTGSR